MEKGHQPMSKSKYLPVPLRNASERALKTNVIVLEPGATQPSASRPAAPLARLALDLAPDILRAFERARSQRAAVVNLRLPATEPAREQRAFTSGVQLSEVELDMRVPFVRRVTIRKATAWTTAIPIPPSIAPTPRSGRLRRAGVVSVGGAVALAALGLLVRGRTYIRV